MVIGDCPVTAQAIATKVNLAKGNKVLQLLKPPSDRKNDESDSSPDINDGQDIESYDTTTTKLLTVQAVQKLGGAVAVTGDGVNDALA